LVGLGLLIMYRVFSKWSQYSISVVLLFLSRSGSNDAFGTIVAVVEDAWPRAAKVKWDDPGRGEESVSMMELHPVLTLRRCLGLDRPGTEGFSELNCQGRFHRLSWFVAEGVEPTKSQRTFYCENGSLCIH
jgi:hypothetical protein